MPTPTSDFVPAQAGSADVPPGLPDPVALAQLAGQFLRALPDAARFSPVSGAAFGPPAGLSPPPGAYGPATLAVTPTGLVPAGANIVPTSPEAPAAVAAKLPALVPNAQAPNGVPDHLLMAAPGYDGRLGSAALAVPQAYPTEPEEPLRAAAGQAGAHSPAAVPSFYFLDETLTRVAPASAGAARDAGASVVPDLARPVPQGIPAFPAIPSIPAAAPGSVAQPAVAGAPANSAYYFLLPLEPAPPMRAPAAGTVAAGHPPFDVQSIRRDFPILQERVNGRPLVWFDNAATTQKPQAVIDRLAWFYAHENSNIHRAAHELAARATDAFEKAREIVRRFLNAGSTDEIVFVRGTTEAINLVAKSWGAQNVGAGDEIVVSHLEHHANIVPWQQLAAEKGAKLRVIPVDDSGQVLLEEYQRLLNDRTKIVAVTQVSNALGTVVPVAEIVELAHRAGARALVDGAQSVAHMRVDVQALDADFFAFSGHKIFGPTGIGAVFGKRELLERMPPWQGGGNMIQDVTFERTIYEGPPARFEAGTGNIADAVGLGEALEYVERIGLENIGRYEHLLVDYATAQLRAIEGVRLIGTAADKASVVSFVLAGATPEEVGGALNEEGIAVRSGHHCAQPILRRFGLEATVRPSLAFYNTCEEIDRMAAVVRQLARARR